MPPKHISLFPTCLQCYGLCLLPELNETHLIGAVSALRDFKQPGPFQNNLASYLDFFSTMCSSFDSDSRHNFLKASCILRMQLENVVYMLNLMYLNPKVQFFLIPNNQQQKICPNPAIAANVLKFRQRFMDFAAKRGPLPISQKLQELRVMFTRYVLQDEIYAQNVYVALRNSDATMKININRAKASLA